MMKLPQVGLFFSRPGVFFHRHRVASMIVGQVIVLTIVATYVASSVFGVSLFKVFAADKTCPSGDTVYTIQPGDTLNKIVQAKAPNMSSQQLAAYHDNGIEDINMIYANQQICVPGNAYGHPLSKEQVPPPATSGCRHNDVTNCKEIEGIIQSVFGPDAPAAENVAYCESTYDPHAANQTYIGDSQAQGLFQILHPSSWNKTSQASKSPFDPQANAIAAHEIFVGDGYSWKDWVCQP